MESPAEAIGSSRWICVPGEEAPPTPIYFPFPGASARAVVSGEIMKLLWHQAVWIWVPAFTGIIKLSAPGDLGTQVMVPWKENTACPVVRGPWAQPLQLGVGVRIPPPWLFNQIT